MCFGLKVGLKPPALSILTPDSVVEGAQEKCNSRRFQCFPCRSVWAEIVWQGFGSQDVESACRAGFREQE